MNEQGTLSEYVGVKKPEYPLQGERLVNHIQA